MSKLMPALPIEVLEVSAGPLALIVALITLADVVRVRAATLPGRFVFFAIARPFAPSSSSYILRSGSF